jgi:hypothetical protein
MLEILSFMTWTGMGIPELIVEKAAVHYGDSDV